MDRRRLLILSKGGDWIKFKDSKVEAICAYNWGANGHVTEEQAAAVTSLDNVFRNNTEITSFDELKYFTKVTSLMSNEFNGCASLKSVDFSNIVSISSNAITNCGLEGLVTFPKCRTFYAGFMSGMPMVTRVNLPYAYTFYHEDRYKWFSDCPDLATVDIGVNPDYGFDFFNFGTDGTFLSGTTKTGINIIFRGACPSGAKMVPAEGKGVFWASDANIEAYKTAFPDLTWKPFSEAPDGLL